MSSTNSATNTIRRRNISNVEAEDEICTKPTEHLKKKYERKRRKWNGVEKFFEAKNLMETLSVNFRKHINNEVRFCD